MRRRDPDTDTEYRETQSAESLGEICRHALRTVHSGRAMTPELETGRTGSPRLPTSDSRLPSLSQEIGRPREPAYGYGHGRRARVRTLRASYIRTHFQLTSAQRSTLITQPSGSHNAPVVGARSRTQHSPLTTRWSMHARKEGSIKFNALPADRPSQTSNSPLATNRPARGTR